MEALPDLWRQIRLGDQVILRDELINPASQPEQMFLCIGLENIESHSGRLLEKPLLSGRQIKSIKRVFYAGDILYGKLRPNLNKVYIATIDGVCSTDILVMRCLPTLDTQFAAYFLRSAWVVRKLSQQAEGVNLPRINARRLRDLLIPLPPLLEQCRIVDILNQADELKLAQNKADARIKMLYKSVFDKIIKLGTQSSHPFTFIKLKDLLKIPITTGVSPETRTIPPGIPIFTLSAITDYGLDETQVKYYPSENYRGKGSDLIKGDILMSRGNTLELVGKVASYQGKPAKVLYSDLMFRIRLKDVNETPFVENYLRSIHILSIIRRLARGTSGSMKKISLKDIQEFDIWWPSPKIRHDWEIKLREIDVLREHQNESLKRIESLFQTLVSQAFTGELTASWREKHRNELDQQAAERDVLLKQIGHIALKTEDLSNEPDSELKVDPISELIKCRQALFDQAPGPTLETILRAALELNGGYFTAETLFEKKFQEDAALDLVSIQRGLEVLVATGFVVQVTLRAPSGGSEGDFYFQAFRVVRETDSADEDIEVLKESP